MNIGSPTTSLKRGRPSGAAANYTEGSVSQHVIKLSGFMMMGFLAMTLAQFIEAIYLGLVGTDELAAVAFTFPLTLALNAAARGIGIGASALVARSIGSGARDGARKLISHCLILVLLFAVSLVLVSWLTGSALIALMGAHGHVLELAASYIHIWMLGFPLFALSMVGSGLIRAVGNASFPGYVMTLGSILQVLMAPLFIFGWGMVPAMGIEGAAWAFVLSRAISAAMTFFYFTYRESLLSADLDGFAQSSNAILHVGLPATLTNLVPSISTAITTGLLAQYGHSVVAGFGMASRVEALVAMVVIAISSSTGPMVGQNWGAQRFDRVRESIRICDQLCLSWGVLAAVLMWFGGGYLVTMINGDDPLLVDSATAFLHIVPISIGFMGMMNVASSAFNALSKPMPPLLLALARALVVYVPLAILGGWLWGYLGIFVATAVANVALGIAAWYWARAMIANESPKAQA